MLACFECKDADEINVSVLLLGVISSVEIVGCGSILITPSDYLFSYTSGQGRLKNKKCAAFYICYTPLTLTLSDPARVCVTRLCCAVDLFSECGPAYTMFTCTSRLCNRPFIYSISIEFFFNGDFTLISLDFPVGS